MGCLIGYARVSTAEQDIRLQLDALRDAGCQDDQVFLDKSSGARTERPGLDACLQALGPGDTLVIWRLDRLGRSTAHLVTLIEDLRQRQGGFARWATVPWIRQRHRVNSLRQCSVQPLKAIISGWLGWP